MTSPNPPIIRLAISSDAEAAWDLFTSCRIALLERGIAQWDALSPSAETVHNDIANATLHVLTAGNDCVGMVTLDANAHPGYGSVRWEFEEPALIVHRLCVRPGLQGMGFGQRLMEFAESHAGDNGYRSIRLDAYSGNPSSVSFYQKRGYRQAGHVFFPRRTLPFCLFERRVDG